MKTIFSTAGLCFVLAFANVASVNASNNDMNLDGPKIMKGNQQKMQKKQMKRMAKVLSLSEQQKVEIKAIKSQARAQHQALRPVMKAFKMAEKKLLQTKTFDEKAYIALHDSNQATFAQSALIRAKAKHEVFNVLTTEQQEKWLKMAEHRKGNSKRMGD